jgi:tetratricopeptide (TPR) repeat protein
MEPITTQRARARESLAAGLTAQLAGQTAAARAAFELALLQAPDDPIALGLLGSLESTEGNLPRAEELLRRGAQLQPGNASTLFNLGLTLLKRDRLPEALRCFDRAVELRPSSVAFLRQRAETAVLVGDRHVARAAWSELLRASDDALAVDSADMQARYCRACALLGLESEEEARVLLTELHAQSPDDFDVLLTLGLALMALRRFGEAHAIFGRAVRLKPAHPLARLNLGNALFKLRKLEAAVACFRELLAISEVDASVHMNLGVALRDLGELREALAHFDRAVALRPGWGEALMSRAYCLLAMGNFERGWAEHEHRVADAVVPWVHRDFGCPRWDGFAPLRGRSILIWAEQGFGDAIHFSRYAAELGKLGARVVFEVHRPLVQLFANLDHVAEVRPFSRDAAHCDFHCALMSLPHLFAARGNVAPSSSAYLSCAPEARSRWAARIDADKINVGLAWTGNPIHSNDHNRSMPLHALLAALPQQVQWWCVQKDVREGDARVLEQLLSIERPPLGDFDDTAGLIANLDVVVTVDTSVAHLSGALGKPTFILLPFAAEWRWQTKRSDSPWYESVRLFRQPSPGDWESPLAEAAAEISALAAARARLRMQGGRVHVPLPRDLDDLAPERLAFGTEKSVPLHEFEGARDGACSRVGGKFPKDAGIGEFADKAAR